MEMNFSQTNVHELNGLGQAKVSQMKTSPLAFDILSKKLYKNKVLAPLRELSSNAVDAHQMVDTPTRPIEVKLPSKQDAQFYVRDHGPGLSEEAVMNLYMTYFESSKSNSNDFTGGFGLGSKSPYCCTDQFYVVSAFEGKQTSYMAYIRNDGYPAISKVDGSEVPVSAEWPHGLQVGYAVPEDKHHEYRTEAQKLYRWYKVKPTISGVADLDLEQTFDFVGDRFSILPARTDNHRRSSSGQSYVIMGTVAYPIETDQTEKLLSPLEQALVKSGVVLNVEMGEVSITASRESLEYDEKTVFHLKAALAHVAQTIVSAYVEAIGIEPETRLMETVQAGVGPFRRALNHDDILETFAAKAFDKLTAKAKKAGKTFDLSKEKVKALVSENHMAAPNWLSTTYDVSVSAFVETRNGTYTARKVLSGKVGRNIAVLSLQSWPVAIVVDDASGTLGRVKVALGRGDLKDALVIRCEDTQKRAQLVKRVAEHFLNLPVIQSSTLPEVPSNRMPRVKAAKGERAASVRVKREELLQFWGHIGVVFHEIQHGDDLKSRTVSLANALKETQYFIQVNGTSDHFVNHAKSNEFSRTHLRSVLTRLSALHPEFEANGLTKVIELRGAQVNQIKARETLEFWDKAVFETLAECAGDIEEVLDTLPRSFDINKAYSYKENTPQHVAYQENQLLSHLDSWDDYTGHIFEVKNGRTVYIDFLEALSQDLRHAVEYVFAARGKTPNPGIQGWGESMTAKMNNVLGSLFEMSASEEDQKLVTGLRSQLQDERDFSFYARAAAISPLFEGLQRSYAFAQFIQESPQRAAQLFNLVWEAGRAAQAQLELVVEEAVAA